MGKTVTGHLTILLWAQWKDNRLIDKVNGVHVCHTAGKDPFPTVSQRSGPLVETTIHKKKIWQTEVSNPGRNVPCIRDGNTMEDI